MNNKNNILFLILLVGTLITGCIKDKPIVKPKPVDKMETMKLQVPAANKIYHSAFPDFGGTEDIVSKDKITAFESLAGKEIMWAYFSNNWSANKGGIKFPSTEVETIRKTGKVPFIRMMPRSNFDAGQVDPLYTMEAFLSGQFDNDIKQWAIDAKNTQIPLLVEFGTEVNGDWFPWNATFNGKNNKTNYGAPGLYDGMERFRDTYRKIIDICKEQGADNITWFYHCDVYSSPDSSWNTKAGYYPGDNYIDWIGVSVYGPQTPNDSWSEFDDILGGEWEEIQAISTTGKPIAILEWGVVENTQKKKAAWITKALESIKEGGQFYPAIKAIAYWHENFDDTMLRIDSSPESLAAYKKGVNDNIFVTESVFE